MNLKHIYSRVLVGLYGAYLLVFMHIYQANMGGGGLSQPINITGWLVITGVICFAVAASFTQRTIVLSRSLVLFLIAALLLCLPLLYPDVRWVNTIARMVGLVGGIIFYATLLQQRVVQKYRILLLWLILASALIEAGYALLQSFILERPNWMEFVPGNRAYGIFQQVNVLSSYMATGLGIAIYLFYVTRNTSGKKMTERGAAVVLLMSASLFSFVIVLIASRVGYLGGGVIALLLLGCFGKRYPGRSWLLIAAIASGALAAKFALSGSWLESLAHEGSNRQRLMILQQSFLMIVEKPWLGWGYGSFEYNFQHFVGAKYPLVINTEIMTHPHNELLYWWVEGGVVAFLGMMLIAAGYLTSLVSAFSRKQLALWGLTLPIALHTMTEYPLYQSVPHLMVLILLLVMADRAPPPEKLIVAVNTRTGTGLRVVVLAAGLIGVPFLATGFQTNKVLTQLERSGMVDFSRSSELVNPYIDWRRFDFDKHVNKLIMFNRTRDEKLLQEYEVWAQAYSLNHIDKNVYLTRIQIAKATDPLKANLILAEAKKVTPLMR